MQNTKKKVISPIDYFRPALITFCSLAAVIVLIKLYVNWVENENNFIIKKINLLGNEYFSADEIYDIAGLNLNESLLRVNLVQAHNNIKAHPFIEDVAIHKIYPNGIEVRIQEKKAVALLRLNKKLYALDASGVVLPSKPGKMYDLPILSGVFKGTPVPGSPVTGQCVLKGLVFIHYIYQKEPNLYAEFSEVVINEESEMTIYTRQHGIPVRMGDDNFEEKLLIFKAFLNQNSQKQEIRQAKYIDLRYEGQVVLGMRSS